MIMLFLLVTSIPSSQTVTCPRICVCDDTKLTVKCIGKNLTHVPPTIKEVSPNRFLNPVNLFECIIKHARQHYNRFSLCIVDHSEIGSEEK